MQMSDIRSILLHLDASLGSASRLAFAHALADRHDARITALFGVRPEVSQAVFAYSAAAALQAAEERDGAIDAARARLRDQLALGERECAWCEVVGDSLVHGFVAERSTPTCSSSARLRPTGRAASRAASPRP